MPYMPEPAKWFGAALFFLCGAALPAWASEAIPSLVSSAAESSHVYCTTHCFLRSIYVTSGAVGGYVLTFNATSAPVDGAVTPIDCVVLPANSTVSLDYGGTSDVFNTGLTAVFSSTGCFTKTASATAFFKGRKQ